MCSLLYTDNILAGPKHTSNVLERIRNKLNVTQESNLLVNGLYSGSATLTQATGVDSETTRSIDPYTAAARFLYKNGKIFGSSNSIQTYSIQNLAGSALRDCAVEFMSDSNSLTLKGRRQSSGGFRLAINGFYVSSSNVTAWSTADAAYNYLIITGLSGINSIRFEWQGNYVFENCYVTPSASVWQKSADIVAAVVGDSYTAGANATSSLDSFVHKLGILMGCDVIFPLGYSGTGYAASLTGHVFSGTTVAGCVEVSVTDTTGLAVGQPIMASAGGGESPYIARHTKIVGVVTNESITLDAPATDSITNGSFFAASSALTPTDYYSRVNGTRRLELDFDRMPRYPDIIFFLLGLNDDANGSGYADVVKETYALARKLCPNALIVNLGVPSTPANGGGTGAPNYVSTYSQNNENIIADVVASFNDPLMISIPNCTDQNAGVGVSWFWGDGKTSNTTGHGNTDIYIGSDGTHPNTAGHLFLAQKILFGLNAYLEELG